MRLIGCYIENFGALHEFKLKFNEGVTVMNAPNGFGKTTFAAFIRAMLYGLPRGNKSSLEKDMRRKYSPWQGGRFGGWLDFEIDGKCYRAERFFGDRPARDSFTLYELPNLRPSTRFTEALGVEIFGLDADSFERSACMSQLSETGKLSTDAIRAKLGNLVEDTEDVNNCDKALANLRKARIKLMPYRGVGGDIHTAEEKLYRLQDELSRCNEAREKMTLVREEIRGNEQNSAEKRANMESLRKRLLSASEQAADRVLAQRQKELAERCERIGDELDTLTLKYPCGLPSNEEITEISRAMDRRSDNVEQNKSGALLPMLIAAAVFAVAGIVAFAMKHYALGGVLLSVGLLCAAGGLYFRYRSIADALEQGSEGKEIDGFFEQYAPNTERSREGLMTVHGDALRYEALCADFDSANYELKKFKAEHPNVREISCTGQDDAERLEAEYERCAAEISELDRRLAESRREADVLRESADRTGELTDAVEHWKRVRAKGLEKCAVLDSTMEYLSLAREKLSEAYLDRIKRGFAEYLNCLTENEAERIFVDSDLTVRIERGGEARDLDYFSAGFSDIVMLCMRLALIDALFEGEKPCIIMDDPLVNLDDAHTEKALALIKKLGSRYQVVYLSCNSSRC